ncbi:MAG: stage II sporulation protein P [Firmicutes bacterium]|nr:stage II sporulation protein P [Dethiobacter sp.]MBS3889359.1 stage II sporulation protein P [Bacillota bacterium]MBS4055311.1 stage II sporulation protein P [Thermaerobacter sp.]
MMKNRGFRLYLLLIVSLVLALATEPIWSRTALLDNAMHPEILCELVDGQHFTVVDEVSGEEIFRTARVVVVGDMYQQADNRFYEVVAVQGLIAKARFLRYESVGEVSSWFPSFLEEWGSTGVLPDQLRTQAREEVRIALYHTHSAESYIPSDGKASIRDKGGIFIVGESFMQNLEKQGVAVEQDRRSHDPHDKRSYMRSRRTAAEMLRAVNPAALLDVHRDALPRRFYTTTIKGNELAQIRLVVGRQNPNIRANKQFAQELMAAANKRYPNLVRDIFFGRGSYNQELHPRALLLELGTYRSTHEEAKDGAELLAGVLAAYLGAAAPADAAGIAREGGAARSSLMFVLGLVLVGGLVFLFLSTGSLKEMGSKMRHFVTDEFSMKSGRKEKAGAKRDDKSSDEGDS